jgi:hypothetical protein
VFHSESAGLHGTRREKEITWIVPLLLQSGDS